MIRTCIQPLTWQSCSGYATSLAAGDQPGFPGGFGFFTVGRAQHVKLTQRLDPSHQACMQIHVALTEKGLEMWKIVVSNVFSYIRLLREGTWRWPCGLSWLQRSRVL